MVWYWNKQKIIALLIIIVLSIGLFTPGPAYARINLRKFGNWILNVPSNITRPLGPVAPIAEFLIFKKFPRVGRFYQKARKIKEISRDLREAKKNLGAVKTAYRDEAKNLRKKADTLRAAKRELWEKLKKKGPSYIPEYNRNVVSLIKTTESLDKAASRLDKKANRLKPRDVVRLFAQNVATTAFGSVKNLVIQDLSDEYLRWLNPTVIQTFINKDGLDPAGVVDLFIDGDINRLLSKGDWRDRPDFDVIKSRLRRKIREQLKNDRQYFIDNWRVEVDAILEDLKNDIKKKPPETQDITETVDSSTPVESGPTVCPVGGHPCTKNCQSQAICDQQC